ncbi:MAG TPA: hypothetical protein VNW47_10770, partial [Terriglobales bacterium]|nr:hypothetical protein [Terriglobales bacterium]
MRNSKWMVLALLVVAMTATMTAAAQQSAPAPDAQQPASVAPQSGPASQQPASAGPVVTSTPTPPPAVAAPTTMDQVVDRFIEREKGLIKMMAPRTPVVETYVQNLTQDSALGPVPSDDRYFLGRMDLSDSIDRNDYLKEKDDGMEKRLLGGFTKMFKFQYTPLGFSWMIY